MPKADIEKRRVEDRERFRLRELDKKDNGSRLYNWTLENDNMARGRKPSMNPIAKELSEALTFVSVAGTKDAYPWCKHVFLNGGWAIMSDGQISAGHPIKEDLSCCPQFDKLQKAIVKCGKSLSITQLDTNRVSIRGDTLRVLVQCLPLADMPEFEWDDNIAPANDKLKVAFKTCGGLANENATTAIEASLLLEANTCSATNRKVVIQYWHGINLPPKLAIPKIFTQAVAKVAERNSIVGFGYDEGKSITLHFQNGAWLKTLLYVDPWPDVNQILDRPSSPLPIVSEFFNAVASVNEFSDDEYVTITDTQIQSHGSVEMGAQYDITGHLQGKNKQLNADHMKLIAPFVQTIDTTTYADMVFFFGENMRGCSTCFINNVE